MSWMDDAGFKESEKRGDCKKTYHAEINGRDVWLIQYSEMRVLSRRWACEASTADGQAVKAWALSPKRAFNNAMKSIQ